VRSYVIMTSYMTSCGRHMTYDVGNAELNIAKSLVLLLLHNIRCSGQRILIISETTLKLYLNYSDIIKTLIPLFRPQNWETTRVAGHGHRGHDRS